MGYYAAGGGYVIYEKPITDEQAKIVDEQFGEWVWTEECGTTDGRIVDMAYDGKYYSDEVETVLDKLAELGPIKEGELEFSGEDNCHWRFLYKDGAWIEQLGHIVYDD